MKIKLKHISLLLACAILSSCGGNETVITEKSAVQTTEAQTTTPETIEAKMTEAEHATESAEMKRITPADLTMTDVAGNVISAADFKFVTIPKTYGWTNDSDEYIALENGEAFNGLEIYDASTRYWFWDSPDETLHFIEAKYSLGGAADSFGAFALNGYIKIDESGESVWFYPELTDDMQKFPFIHEKGFHGDMTQTEVGTITFEGGEIPVQTVPVCIYSEDKTKEKLMEYADGAYHYVALSFENIDFRTGAGGTQCDTDPQIQTLAEGFIRNIKNAEK